MSKSILFRSEFIINEFRGVKCISHNLLKTYIYFFFFSFFVCFNDRSYKTSYIAGERILDKYWERGRKKTKVTEYIGIRLLGFR